MRCRYCNWGLPLAEDGTTHWMDGAGDVPCERSEMSKAEELIDQCVEGSIILREDRAFFEMLDRVLEDIDEKESVPKDPEERAYFRISALVKRFKGDEDKVDKHTVLRVKKTNKAAKLKGIIKAAKHFKLKNAEKAARQKLKSLG